MGEKEEHIPIWKFSLNMNYLFIADYDHQICFFMDPISNRRPFFRNILYVMI